MSSNNEDDNNKIIARKTLVNLLGKTILTRNQKRKLNELLDDFSTDNSPPPRKKRKLEFSSGGKIYNVNLIMSMDTKSNNKDEINESIDETKTSDTETSNTDDSNKINEIDESDEDAEEIYESINIDENDLIISDDEDSDKINDYVIDSSSDEEEDNILVIDEDNRPQNTTKDINRQLLEGILRTKLRASIKKAIENNMSQIEEMEPEYELQKTKSYKNLSISDKMRIKEIEAQIKEINDKSVPERVKILLSDIPLQTKAIIIKKLDLLETLENSGSEYKKLREWIDNILKIPFGKYCKFDITKDSDPKLIAERICNIKTALDKAVYGHEQVKEALVELVAKWISNPPSKGHALAIVGPPGCGKTSLFRQGLAKALNRPFASFSLSGLSDESYLSGFAHTYEGSDYGRICRMLTETGCMNPIIFMDELDKIDTTRHGSSVVNKIMEIVDFSQNHEYEDMYFGNIKIDLSRVLFVFSLNHLHNIDPILRDRLEIIKVKGFESKQKVKILKDYIIPSELKEVGLKQDDIIFPDKSIAFILRKIRKEEGVREAKRAIQIIIRKINLLQYVSGSEKKKIFSYYSDNIKLPIKVTDKLINKLLIEEEPPAFLNLYI
jgi:ATP-dependent Lon protease